MTSLPALGSVVAGKYRIDALLGQGGMGAVFRAHHALMDKAVALKWLHPRLWDNAEAKERFVREARAVARIRHPNVVEVFDVCVEDDALYMVMELLEGDNLEALLQAAELSITEALGYVAEAMHGVAAAHARGIIHRDIKPENIFVARAAQGASSRVKILDFGISKLIDDGEGAAQVTKTGSTMGTPAYMSFEHMNGAKDVDERTDIYSFGVVLYRVLTGALPFSGDTFAGVAVQLATQRPMTPKQLRPELPSYLDGVVMKAMAFDKRDRYPSLGALIDALALVTSDEGYLRLLTQPEGSVPDVVGRASGAAAVDRALLRSTRRLEPTPASSEPMRTAPPARRRQRRLAAVALGAASALLAGLGWLFRPGPEATSTRPPAAPAAAEAPHATETLHTQPANAPVPQTAAPNDNAEWDQGASSSLQAEALPSPVVVEARGSAREQNLDAGANLAKVAPVSSRSSGVRTAHRDAGLASDEPAQPKVLPRSARIRPEQF